MSSLDFFELPPPPGINFPFRDLLESQRILVDHMGGKNAIPRIYSGKFDPNFNFTLKMFTLTLLAQAGYAFSILY